MLIIGRAREKIDFFGQLRYNETMNWNPLYLDDKDVTSLEDAIREAEWTDDILQAEQER